MKGDQKMDDISNKFAEILISDCAKKMSRDLTKEVKEKLYSLGSLMFMESVDMDLSNMTDPNEISDYILNLPDRKNT
jgi:hypothetical protein